jgi:hypothetical protein
MIRDRAATNLAEALSAYDRRSEPRVRTNTPARLFYGAGRAFWVDCVIKDRSRSGAKVQAPALFDLPNQLVLLDFEAGCAYEAQLRWRKAELAGLWLHKAHEMATLKDPAFEEVRKAWDFLAPALGYGPKPQG